MYTLSTTWDICLQTWALVQVTFVYRHEMEITNSTLQMCYIWFIFCELMCRFVFWNWYLTLLQEQNEVNKEQCVTCQIPRQWNIITPPISVSTRCCLFLFCFLGFFSSHPWNKRFSTPYNLHSQYFSNQYISCAAERHGLPVCLSLLKCFWS